MEQLKQRIKKMTDKQLIDGVANYSNWPLTVSTRSVMEPFIDLARKEIERRQKIGQGNN